VGPSSSRIPGILIFMSSFDHTASRPLGVIPELIESDRIILLSPPRIEHDQAYIDMMNDPLSMQHLSAMSKRDSGGWVLDDAETRRNYASAAQASRDGWFCHILLKSKYGISSSHMWKLEPLLISNSTNLRYLNQVPPRDNDTHSAVKIGAVLGATGLSLDNTEFVGVTGFRGIDWNNLQAEIGIILCSKNFKSGGFDVGDCLLLRLERDMIISHDVSDDHCVYRYWNRGVVPRYASRV
jgi:RimJ/RimL family protein N-acetyltransferase